MTLDIKPLSSNRQAATHPTQTYGGEGKTMRLLIHAEHGSLGIVLWQCASGGFPFGEENPILSDHSARKSLEDKIAKEDPGRADACEDIPGISELVQQCWKRRGDLRP